MSTPYDDILELAKKAQYARVVFSLTTGTVLTPEMRDEMNAGRKFLEAMFPARIISLITDLEAANKTIAALRSTYCELETP